MQVYLLSAQRKGFQNWGSFWALLVFITHHLSFVVNIYIHEGVSWLEPLTTICCILYLFKCCVFIYQGQDSATIHFLVGQAFHVFFSFSRKYQIVDLATSKFLTPLVHLMHFFSPMRTPPLSAAWSTNTQIQKSRPTDLQTAHWCICNAWNTSVFRVYLQ